MDARHIPQWNMGTLVARQFFGKKLPLKLITNFALTMVVLVGFSGCQFFGRLEDQAIPPIGQLGDGSSFVGSWTYSNSGLDSNGHPTYAITETYTFDPTGTARVEIRDVLSNGITCTGYGQYRQTGAHDLIIYLQAAEPANCGFPYQIQLTQIEVSGQVLKFKDPKSGYVFDLFKVRPVAALAPVGVWDFDSAGADQNGDGGIDYLFLDPKGYFLIQTKSNGEMYLLVGFYTVVDSSLTLNFFANMDPAQVVGTPIVYKQFITNGTTLELIEQTDQGDVVIDGARL